uniref:Uncharacterized protein n=1 Tax=Salarias fasciatus TaxID=181472 RepID=A0A672J4J6_SALFA
QNHRAPSVGLFALGLSAAFCLFRFHSSYLAALQREAEWAAKALAPALVSFDYLWLSEDRNTARILLCGSCLLLTGADWLSADSLTVMTHCLGLSSLSCCLTVCLFAGNALGALGGVALNLPLLVTVNAEVDTVASLVSPAASRDLLNWIMKGSLAIGCWTSRLALEKFRLDWKKK